MKSARIIKQYQNGRYGILQLKLKRMDEDKKTKRETTSVE